MVWHLLDVSRLDGHFRHPWLHLDMLQPILERGDKPTVFLDMLLTNEPHWYILIADMNDLTEHCRAFSYTGTVVP